MDHINSLSNSEIENYYEKVENIKCDMKSRNKNFKTKFNSKIEAMREGLGHKHLNNIECVVKKAKTSNQIIWYLVDTIEPIKDPNRKSRQTFKLIPNKKLKL